MLAIVLIMNHCFDTHKLLDETVALLNAVISCAIGIATPGKVGFSQIANLVPAFFVNHSLQAGTIGTGFRAKYSKSGAMFSLALAGTASYQFFSLFLHAMSNRIVRAFFVQGTDCPHRFVKQLYLSWKSCLL